VPAQRCVRVRAGGEVVQTINLGPGCFGCALGGPDATTLFMMAVDFSEPASVMGSGVRTGHAV